jgi:hypothetical protein
LVESLIPVGEGIRVAHEDILPSSADKSSHNPSLPLENINIPNFALAYYKIEIPSMKLVKCLEIISSHDNGKLSKKKLKDIAIQNKLIHERSREDDRGDEYSEQAGFMALNKTLIEPLRSWRFITVEKVGSHHVVSLTDEGRDALRFLKV